ncbi:MAG: SDR family NAD(P)-dependent oxidoreductase [Alphaproteobacteria bacterium]
MGFAGKSALVTGAGGGMGLAIAEALLAEGAHVALVDLKPSTKTLGGKALYLQGDVSDEAFVADAFARAHAAAGHLDYLVNAAAVLWFDRDKSAVEMTVADWNRIMAINLTAAVLTVRHAVPLMKAAGGGAMVHVSSIQCLRGDPMPQDAYQASKAGLIALSKSMAIQYARDGIRSNALLPGPTLSPMQARWEGKPEAQARVAGRIPLGRLGTVEDQANACLFLLSDRAAYITGIELIVDGGVTAMP